MRLGAALAVLLTAALAQADTRCPVYSFFEFLSPADLKTGRQDRMLRSWFRNWYANGWDPVILRLEDAVPYPDYQRLYDRFHAFPTVNKKAYEMACFLRWLAFGAHGAGVFVDYDIMNMRPDQLPPAMGRCGAHPREPGQLSSFRNHWPMVMFADALGVRKLIHTLANYTVDPELDRVNGKPHLSDMSIVRRIGQSIIDEAPPSPPGHIWHFANSAHAHMGKRLAGDDLLACRNVSRSDWIRRTLTADFVWRKRVRVWTGADGHLDPAAQALLAPILSCPGPDDIIHKIGHEHAALRKGEVPLCDCRRVTTIDDQNEEDEFSFLFVEPVAQRIIRQFAGAQPGGPAFREYMGARTNQLVRALAPECFGADSSDVALQECTAFAAAKVSSNSRLVVGLSDRLEESKTLIEYSIGFYLPEPPAAQKAAPSSAREVFITQDEMDEMLQLNWADVQLVDAIHAMWWDRLSAVTLVENQVERYNDLPSRPLSSDYF